MIIDKFLVGEPQADTRLTGRKIIVPHLRLREPVYLRTAAYGHFGRDEFAWERVDATDELLVRARSGPAASRS